MMPATQKPQQARDIVAPGWNALFDLISIQSKLTLMYPLMKPFQFLETQGPGDLSCRTANHIDVFCPLIDVYDLKFVVLVGSPKFRVVFLHFSQDSPPKATSVLTCLSFRFVSLGHVTPKGSGPKDNTPPGTR